MVDLAPSPFFVALPPVKIAYKPGTVTHTCKPRYLRGWDQEDRSSRLAQANSLWDSISKITRAKWTDCVAQTVEHLFCKYEALSSKPSPIKKKKKRLHTVYRPDSNPWIQTGGKPFSVLSPSHIPNIQFIYGQSVILQSAEIVASTWRPFLAFLVCYLDILSYSISFSLSIPQITMCNYFICLLTHYLSPPNQI
jgi:hypothetical protein